MKKMQIKKAVQKAVEKHLPHAIKSHAVNAAYDQVRAAMQPGKEDDSGEFQPLPPGTHLEPVGGSSTTTAFPVTRVVRSAPPAGRAVPGTGRRG